MPLIALIGSEAPGRIEWALSHNADAQLLKPVGNAGVYSALLIARQAFEARRRLADEIASLDGLTLGGLMTVAPLGADPRPVFDRLVALSADLRQQHPGAAAVSAGMSDDFEHAVAAGATHLRVGRSVLGERPPAR
jgi:hypothetical protein